VRAALQGELGAHLHGYQDGDQRDKTAEEFYRREIAALIKSGRVTPGFTAVYFTLASGVEFAWKGEVVVDDCHERLLAVSDDLTGEAA
jgi:hypothetical protein